MIYLKKNAIASCCIDLSDDLIMEILGRLPIKSLARFKCASKIWHGLISDLTSLTRKPITMSGLFCNEIRFRDMIWWDEQGIKYVSLMDDADDIINTSLSFLPWPYTWEWEVLDCCNGLLLCKRLRDFQEHYYVCNPVTKRWAQIPVSLQRSYRWFLLTFDPIISSPNYNVICFSTFIFNELGYARLMVFSSQKVEWLKSRVFVRQPKRDTQVFLNRVLYMLTYEEKVFAFHVEKDDYSMIDLPKDEEAYSSMKCLGACRNCLYYARHDYSDLQVWVLEDFDNNEWVLKHSISQTALLEKCPLYENIQENSFYAKAFHCDFDVIFLLRDSTIFSLNFDTERLEEVCSLIKDYSPRHWQVFPFLPCPFVDPLLNKH